MSFLTRTGGRRPIGLGLAVIASTLSVGVAAGRHIDRPEALVGLGLGWAAVITMAIFIVYSHQRLESENLSVRTLKEELTSLKDDVLSMLTTEFRAPAAGAYGWSATLVDHWGDLEEETKLTLARRISGQAGRLNRAIGDMADLAELRAGTVRPELFPLNIERELGRAVERLHTALADHSIKMHVPDTITALGDPALFAKVADVLITNAVKFSEKGSLIILRARACKTNVQVSIDDNGPGLPAEVIDKIFDAHFQIKGPLGERPAGLGIGLAVARLCVELQGGTISAESVPNRGTTFAFSLPVSPHSHGEFQPAPLAAIATQRERLHPGQLLRWL